MIESINFNFKYMPVPDYHSLMLPLLQLTSDNEINRFRELVEALASRFDLLSEDRKELLPSGTQPFFDKRVG